MEEKAEQERELKKYYAEEKRFFQDLLKKNREEGRGMEEQERQRQALATPDEGDEADFRDAALDTPVESRKRIEFAPADEAAQAKSVEEDDDYDELL